MWVDEADRGIVNSHAHADTTFISPLTQETGRQWVAADVDYS